MPYLVDTQVAKFIRLIESKYLCTDTELRPVDIARKVQYLTLDVISTIAFGAGVAAAHADDCSAARVASPKKSSQSDMDQNKITKPDMLGSFVAHGLSQRDAEAESLVQIVAGSDTTATTLRIALLLLTTSPKTYTTLASEIDRAISQSRISSPVTDAEARALPYLQACIKECFRFWPPITGIMPRICPREAMVCGVKVPGGYECGMECEGRVEG
ncbi:hypothetical protein RJ035_002743 [Blastomyces gilchristii]